MSTLSNKKTIHILTMLSHFSIGIAALMQRLNRSQVTVGIDGSLYKFHPRFRERMTDIIDKLKPESVQVVTYFLLYKCISV